MPKANVVLADGTKVTIDGTPDEVAAVLQRIAQGRSEPTLSGEPRVEKRRRRKAAGKGRAKAANERTRNKGPADYLRELVLADFFKTKRGLRDVQKKLEEGAHIYPVTHLSPALFRLVRARELRRMKEDGTWKYVNP